MSAEKEQETHRRRRSHTHGFFDHGDRDYYPGRVRFAGERERNESVWQRLRHIAQASVPFIRFAINSILGILATIAIVGPLVILASTSVRGVGLLCSYHILPQSTSICSNEWVKPHESILSNLRENQTPLTQTLHELNELTKISTSLDFIGLAMHTVSQNLTTTFSDFKTHKDALNFKGDQSFIKLARTATTTHQLIEAFSTKDTTFRQDHLPFEENGLADLLTTFTQTNSLLKNTSTLTTAALQLTLHTLPYGSQSSLSYNILQTYHHFLQTQEEEVGILVYLATESKLKIQALFSRVGNLHTRLEKLVTKRREVCLHRQKSTAALCHFNPTPPILTIETHLLPALFWIHKVLELAESRYKNLFSAIYRVRGPLEGEIQSYEKCWAANQRVVAVGRLRRVLDVEESQVGGLLQRVEENRKVVERVHEEMMGSWEGYERVRWLLEEQMREGRVGGWLL